MWRDIYRLTLTPELFFDADNLRDLVRHAGSPTIDTLLAEASATINSLAGYLVQRAHRDEAELRSMIEAVAHLGQVGYVIRGPFCAWRADGIRSPPMAAGLDQPRQFRRFIVRHEVEGALEFERSSAADRSAHCVGHIRNWAHSLLCWNENGRLARIMQADESGHVRRAIAFGYDRSGQVFA
jgi:hypothetical protein